MKTLDIVHDLSSGGSADGRGLCRVRCFANGDSVVVLLTDLGELNDGQSVTNAIERFVESLVAYGYVVPPATFIEHYERPDPRLDTFDRVIFSPHATWQPLSMQAVLDLIGAPSHELTERSHDNRRVVDLAGRLRYRRNRFADSRYPESNEVVRRRLEIAERRVSRAAVEALVQQGAGERALLQLLWTDLSLLGEAYAKPDDEYIGFAEYPLAGGAVDFVVFTGRSRMDIILVEVKGADFNLVNANHYGAFHHRVTEAATQIQARLGAIFRDLSRFRDEAHAMRIAAEQGDPRHHAFLGPYSCLQVDPDKDVNIRSVVIGGRTAQDLEESRKRQDYEARFVPPVRIESWDTWLRRLQRA